jgi:diguanylate cyclase
VRPAAAAKGVRLASHLPPKLLFVLADRSRLRQVLSNLLNNALKFTPSEGTIEVSLRRDAGRAMLRVRDSGAGIPSELLPHIFDRFRQVETTGSYRTSGLGLGLSIAKQLVDLHGGTIEAASEGEGQGAEFVVSLRALDVAASTNPDDEVRVTELTALSGITVLVADDDLDSCASVERLLGSRGARVWIASSVREALAILRSTHIDVLVSDLGMPDRDGFDFIRDVRSNPERAKRNVRAIALSALARPEDRSRALGAGFDDHLVKPVSAHVLIQAVRRPGRADQGTTP